MGLGTSCSHYHEDSNVNNSPQFSERRCNSTGIMCPQTMFFLQTKSPQDRPQEGVMQSTPVDLPSSLLCCHRNPEEEWGHGTENQASRQEATLAMYHQTLPPTLLLRRKKMFSKAATGRCSCHSVPESDSDLQSALTKHL